MNVVLVLVVAVVLHLIPAGVGEFTVEISEGEDREQLQFQRQEDGGWLPKGEEGGFEPFLLYLSGTEVTLKADGESTTQDLAEHLTIGAMPFDIRHQPNGLDFLIDTGEDEERLVRVRWEVKEE